MDYTPEDIAEKLGQYKIKGDEINIKHCPYCGPNKKSSNQWKFYLNRNEGTFYCHRQKKCGVKGSFKELLQHIGLDDDIDSYQVRRKRTVSKYKKPQKQVYQIKEGDPQAKFFKGRGISLSTLANHKTGKNDGNIAFKYEHNGEHVMTKFRNLNEGENKGYWQEKGGKPVLWGIDDIDTDNPVVITEGEIDKLTLHEVGFKNVVSVPFGSNNFDWIDHSWDKLEDINEFIIWADNDEAGKEMQEEIAKRLGEEKCKVVELDRYNDANELYLNEGGKAVVNAVKKADKLPVERLISIKEIDPLNPDDIESVESVIPRLDEMLGGYMMGMLTIWTGVNGSGKSTILMQEAVNAIEQGYRTALVSGELPDWLVRHWLELQAAGPGNVGRSEEKDSGYVPGEFKAAIRDWFDGDLWYYKDIDTLKTDDIITTFKRGARRYGIKNFIVDNLMVVDYSCGPRDKYNRQAEFVARLKDFARNYDCHVSVVAHPRKPKEGIITKEDVAGLYEITNVADNVLAIHRVTRKNEDEFDFNTDDVGNVLDIFKCRMYGKQDIRIKLGFEELCKRFYQTDRYSDVEKKYSWEELLDGKE